MSIEKRYYEVECKCGHTGSRMYYIPIKFPVIAYNAKEAAAKARQFPRCKHHHKDCILNLKEIAYEEYIDLVKSNRNDPYLKCGSIQEQRQFDIFDRFVEDPHYYLYEDESESEEQRHQLFIGKNKIRNPKKFIRNNYIYEEAFSY